MHIGNHPGVSKTQQYAETLAQVERQCPQMAYHFKVCETRQGNSESRGQLSLDYSQKLFILLEGTWVKRAWSAYFNKFRNDPLLFLLV